MKNDLVSFLYAVHEQSDPYPIESCAEMLHGHRIIDANDLDEIMKNATMADRKMALVRALSTKDDVMMLVWAKILDDMGFQQLGDRARRRYNDFLETEEGQQPVTTIRRGQSTERLNSSRGDETRTSLSIIGDQLSSVPDSPAPLRRNFSKVQKNWRLGDVPNHLNVFLDRDEEWDIRSSILQLFHPGAQYSRPAPSKRPNRAPRNAANDKKGSQTFLPKIIQSQQVSVLQNSNHGSLVDLTMTARPKFNNSAATKPLLLAVTGQRGIGKSTMIAHIVSDDVFLQRQCGVGTVIWLNAAPIESEDEFFAEIASRVGFYHPKDSRLKMRDILPAVLANLKQAVLLVVDDATIDNLSWFSLLGGKILRCIFIFKGERDEAMLTEKLVPQLSKESIIVQHLGRVQYEDLHWLMKQHWKSELAMPPGLRSENFEQIADSCHGMPLMTSLVLTLLDSSTSEEQTATVLNCLSRDADSYRVIGSLIDVALSREKEEFRYRFYWMLAFGQGQPISVEDLSIVWNTPINRAKLYCVDLVDKGLIISASSEPGKINKLHDDCSYVIQKAIYDAVAANLKQKKESAAIFVTRKILSQDYRNPKLLMSRPAENFFHLLARTRNVRLFRTLVNIISHRDTNETLEALCREQDRFQNATPLHILFERASQESWELLSEIAERLVDTDVCTAVKDKKGRSVCEVAVADYNVHRVGSGQTLLMLAARQLCHQFVKQLIEAAQNYERATLKHDFLNAKDDYGRTILHQQSAEEGGSTHMVKLLVEHGADLEAVDNKRRTALHYVARFGCIDVCGVLIDRKCQHAPVDDCGKTPLMLAKIGRHYAVVRLLEGYQIEFGGGARRRGSPEQRAFSAGVGDTEAFLHDIGMQTMPTTSLPGANERGRKKRGGRHNSNDSDMLQDEEDEASFLEEYSDEGGMENGSPMKDLDEDDAFPDDMDSIAGASQVGKKDHQKTVVNKAKDQKVQGGGQKVTKPPANRFLKQNTELSDVAESERSPDNKRKVANKSGHVGAAVENNGEDQGKVRHTDRKMMTAHTGRSDVTTGKPQQTHSVDAVNKPPRHSDLNSGATMKRHDSEPGVKPTPRQSQSGGADMVPSLPKHKLNASPRVDPKIKRKESIRLHKASKIKICVRRGDVPEQIVYFERREEEEKLREALYDMCSAKKTGIIALGGEKGCGAATLVGEVIQQDDFIRDVCFVDLVLWVRMHKYVEGSNLDLYEYDEEAFYRGISRCLQIHEPSANPTTTSEQRTNILERKIRESLIDRARPVVLVVENVSEKHHQKIAASIDNLRCPILKNILISRVQATPPQKTHHHHHQDEEALLLASFGEQVTQVRAAIRVKTLAKSKLGNLFQAYWSKPLQVINPLEAILAKCGNQAALELPKVEDLAEIYVGRPSLVANILYIALKSLYFEQDIQESFYGYVESLRQRHQLPSTDDPDMPPKLSQSEASILQVLKFVLEKEPKDFKRRYYSFLLFDDSDVTSIANSNASTLGTIAENGSIKATSSNAGLNEEIAVAIVWNPFRQRFDNDLLLRALRRLGLTRHVGKYNYEVSLLVLPNALLAQMNKPDFQMPMKAHKYLAALVTFRAWFLANSLLPNEAPPPATQRTTARSMDEGDTVSLRSGEATSRNDALRAKLTKGKKRVVVACMKPKKLSTTRNTNRSLQSVDGGHSTTSGVATRNPYATGRKPIPHILLEGGKERQSNPLVAVLYYFDKVLHGQ